MTQQSPIDQSIQSTEPTKTRKYLIPLIIIGFVLIVGTCLGAYFYNKNTINTEQKNQIKFPEPTKVNQQKYESKILNLLFLIPNNWSQPKEANSIVLSGAGESKNNYSEPLFDGAYIQISLIPNFNNAALSKVKANCLIETMGYCLTETGAEKITITGQDGLLRWADFENSAKIKSIKGAFELANTDSVIKIDFTAAGENKENYLEDFKDLVKSLEIRNLSNLAERKNIATDINSLIKESEISFKEWYLFKDIDYNYEINIPLFYSPFKDANGQQTSIPPFNDRKNGRISIPFDYVTTASSMYFCLSPIGAPADSPYSYFCNMTDKGPAAFLLESSNEYQLENKKDLIIAGKLVEYKIYNKTLNGSDKIGVIRFLEYPEKWNRWNYIIIRQGFNKTYDSGINEVLKIISTIKFD